MENRAGFKVDRIPVDTVNTKVERRRHMSAIDDFDGNNFSAGPGVGALHFPETFDDVERLAAIIGPLQPGRIYKVDL